jgi:hypothetical protein
VPGIDPAIDHVVARLLARDPEDRFPSARALARALVPLVGERGQAEQHIAAMLRTGAAASDRSSNVPTARSVQRVA